MSALFSTLAFVSLYIASIWPTGQVGFAASASLFVAAAVIETGRVSGICVFIISSALSLLLSPNRAAPLLYIAFFGYYPVIKSFIEQSKRVVLEWVLKLLVFNASLTVIWFLLRGFILDIELNQLGIVILYIGGSVLFAVFDYGFTKVVNLYINRISKFTGK